MLGDHEGPFRVEIRDGDIMDLFWVCGFGDLDELDKAGLARMRGMYGFPERVRMPNGQSFVPDEHGFITGEIAVDLDDIIDGDRKSVVKGKSVSDPVDLGGRRIDKKKNTE